MNYLWIACLALTLIPLVLSTVFGIFKGGKRAIVRLVLVGLSFGGALLFKDKLTDVILAIEIDGQTIMELIASMLPEDIASMSDLMKPLVTLLVGVVSYLVLFIALLLVTYIIFLITKIFIKPKMFGKKFKLLGLGLGLIQGAFIGLFLAGPVCGLCSDLKDLAKIEVSGTKVADSLPEGLDFEALEENKLASTEKNLTKGLYAKLSSGTIDGKEATISGQVQAISAGCEIANQLSALTELNFDAGLTADNVDEIKNVFASLGDMQGDLTPEAVETINSMLTEVASSFDLPVNLDNLDLATIDFGAEGEIVGDLLTYTEKEELTTDDINNLVATVAESELILPILADSAVDLQLNETEKSEALDAVNNLEDVDEETKDQLKALLGITD